MDNILFFLVPKAMCSFVYDDSTIRQALEKMEQAGFSALPILNKRGEYRGTLTEGDILWALKNMCWKLTEGEIIFRFESPPLCMTWYIEQVRKTLFRWWMIRKRS